MSSGGAVSGIEGILAALKIPLETVAIAAFPTVAFILFGETFLPEGLATWRLSHMESLWTAFVGSGILTLSVLVAWARNRLDMRHTGVIDSEALARARLNEESTQKPSNYTKRIVLTVYILGSTIYLYSVEARGLADFLYLLIPLLMWGLVKRLSLANRIIWMGAAVTIAAFAMFQSRETEHLRFWCYSNESIRLYAPQSKEDWERHSEMYKLYCANGNEFTYIGISLLLPSLIIGPLAGIISFIWRERN